MSEQREPTQAVRYSDQELIYGNIRRWKAYTDISGIVFGDYDDGLALRLRSTSFANIYGEQGAPQEAILRASLEKYPLTDLGGGQFGLEDDILDRYGITQYTNVDLQNTDRETYTTPDGKSKTFVPADILAYVKELPDSSSNVMANGVIHSDWFTYARNPDWFPNSHEVPKQIEYVRRLFSHIHRVLPSDGVFVANYFDFHDMAIQSGLVKDERFIPTEKPNELFKPRSINVYRKAKS